MYFIIDSCIITTRMKRILPPLFALTLIATVTLLVIYYGRGYRLDFKQKTVAPKGLLVANSQPNGAQVFVNSELTSATNSTITLDPGWYKVRIEKEGYSAWEKELRVQGVVVAKTDTILFPINPSLSPITITGVANPKLSPDGNKIVFNVTKNNINIQEALDGDGVFILDLNDRPLGANRNARQIAKNIPLSFENATYTWEPTGKSILAKIGERYLLLDVNTLNTNPTEVTSILPQLFEEWTKTKQTLEKERLSALKPALSGILIKATKTITWSPDETKILYEATSSATIPEIVTPPLIGTNPTKEERNIKLNQIYVYDIKEDKNFFISETTLPLQWFPTSSHLLLTEDGKISVMDYDGTNKITLYAGPFINGLAAPWPNGSKIVILTSLNPQPDAKPNLYAINIR